MKSMSWKTGLALSVVIAVVSGVILFGMGRELIFKGGYVKLWHGEVVSSENSQHLMDWYTPSHVLHGLVFYLITYWTMARFGFGVGARLVVSTLVEAAWEVAENTDAVINRYREATIALDYFGDSVVNSLADIAAMWFGFWLARVLPVWMSVVLFLLAEAIVVYFIRDGLLLNVLMLLYPIDAVRDWQAG